MNRFLCAFAAFVLAFLPPSLNAQSFEGLGDLPGGSFYSTARGVSADGLVVVGASSSDSSGRQNEAFRWTASEGMQPLGDLPGGAYGSVAEAVSADGSIVVGHSMVMTYGGNVPFRWTAEEGLTELAGRYPDGAYIQGEAHDISADGTVVVGYAYLDGWPRISRWVNGEREHLGTLPGNMPRGGGPISAFAVSADGNVVVGASPSKNAVYLPGEWNVQHLKEAFRWTADGGMEALGALPGERFHSEAHDVSDDGLVVVGESPSGVFRWTGNDGIESAGTIPGVRHLYAVSADGSVAVGGTNLVGAGRGPAVIWTKADGMRVLQDVLETDYGLDLSGWELRDATDITPDATVIVGTGINPDGQFEAWRAMLGTGTANVPEQKARDFTLAAYPNPTSSATSLELTVPSIGDVRVEVFDVIGRRVALVHEGTLSPGMHKLYFDASKLPAGVYLTRASISSAGVVIRSITVTR